MLCTNEITSVSEKSCYCFEVFLLEFINIYMQFTTLLLKMLEK